jgi:hypothetical protein
MTLDEPREHERTESLEHASMRKTGARIGLA